MYPRRHDPWPQCSEQHSDGIEMIPAVPSHQRRAPKHVRQPALLRRRMGSGNTLHRGCQSAPRALHGHTKAIGVLDTFAYEKRELANPPPCCRTSTSALAPFVGQMCAGCVIYCLLWHLTHSRYIGEGWRGAERYAIVWFVALWYDRRKHVGSL